ncbi:MAG: antibiotic biosynthesis monooxygenase [Pseudomonadota bacterium]
MNHHPDAQPPYYAVIFAARLRDQSADYAQVSATLETLAAEQPGYLGFQSARDADGFGLAVSYWRTAADIAAWKAVLEHQIAQKRGRAEWYSDYAVHVAKVDRAYAMSATSGAPNASSRSNNSDV